MNDENVMQEFQVKREGDRVTLAVEVPQEAVRQKEDELLRAIAREVLVPGFRPGKAPKHLVLARYGEQEFEDELKKALIREWLNGALAKAGLEPATAPEVSGVEFRRGEHLSFQASFEVLPEVEIPDQLAIPLAAPPVAEVGEEEVQETLADLRRQAAVLEPKGGPAEAGDVVRIGQGERMWEVEIDPDRPIGKQLVGVKAGDRVELQDEQGHTGEFEVMTVYKLILPDEEETATHFGEESWDALVARVREELLKRKEDERRHSFRLAALDALADHLKLEPPAGLLAEATEEEMKALRVKPELRGEVEQAIRRRLRREILARELAKQKGLLPTEEEVKARAQQAMMEPERAWGRLVFERASDWIIERARRGK